LPLVLDEGVNAADDTADTLAAGVAVGRTTVGAGEDLTGVARKTEPSDDWEPEDPLLQA